MQDVTQAWDTNETINTSKTTINSTMSEDSLMLQTSSESLVVVNGDCHGKCRISLLLSTTTNVVYHAIALVYAILNLAFFFS